MPTFREMLLRLGASFRAGDWFGLDDSDIGWTSSKMNRRCVLIDDHSGEGPAKVFARTTTGRGEIEHPPHTSNHEEGCILTKAGRIRTHAFSVDGRLLLH